MYTRAQQSLIEQGIRHEALALLAAPFTSLAWRVVVVSGDAYYVAYHSLLALAPELRLAAYDRAPELLGNLDGEWAVQRLRWFTKGLYSVKEAYGEVRLTDLRMGVEPDRYAFSFVVGARQSPTIAPVEPRRIAPRRNRDGELESILGILRGAPAL